MTSPRRTRKRSSSSLEKPSTTKGSKACWNDITTKVLLEVMIEEVYAGNRVNGKFNPDGWRNIVHKFGLRTGLAYTRVQLKNRSSLICKMYGNWRKLNDRATGLGLDPATGALRASDEWWSAMGHEDSEILKWRESPPKLIDLMTELFAGNVATGKDTYWPSYSRGGGTFPPPPFFCPPTMHINPIPPVIVGEVDVTASNICLPAPSPSLIGDSSKNKRSRNSTSKKSIGDRIGSSMENMVDEMKYKNARLASLIPTLDDLQEMDTAMSLLHKIERIPLSGRFYSHAVRILDDKLKRYTFINYISKTDHETQIEWFKGWII